MLKRQLILFGVLGGINTLACIYYYKCRQAQSKKRKRLHDKKEDEINSLYMDEMDEQMNEQTNEMDEQMSEQTNEMDEQTSEQTNEMDEQRNEMDEQTSEQLYKENKEHLRSKRQEMFEMSDNLDKLKNKLYDIQMKLQEQR